MSTHKSIYTDSEMVIDKKENIQKCKYLLPKLKSYSQNDVITYSNLSLKKQGNSHYKSTQPKHLVTDSVANSTELSKLSLIKYQYISKSPNYFKRQSRSINSVRIDDHLYHQPVQTYLESKMKQFNKKALIDLVNNRVKSMTNKTNLLTIQQANDNQNQTINSRLTKNRINYEKINDAKSFQRLNTFNPSKNVDNKHAFQAQSKISNHKGTTKLELKTKNTISQNSVNFVKGEFDKQDKKFKTIQQKTIEFYQTKYSNFEPNKMQSVKNQIKNIKKYPSLKLNLYNFQ